jgi:uncharacterized membrane protein YphA (DoxX/SURF4 family)
MNTAAHWLLRIGVAFALLYPPFNALANPDSWLGYFPQFLLASGIPSMVLLHGFGIIEVVIALWILSGWHIEWPAAIAAVMLVAIVAFNFIQFEILFRDLTIAAACLALAADAYGKRKNRGAAPSSV